MTSRATVYWSDDTAKYEVYHWSDDEETLKWWVLEHSVAKSI